MKNKIQKSGKILGLVVLLCLVSLAILASFEFIHNTSINRKVPVPLSDPNILMVGQQNTSTIDPLLLSINTTDFSIHKVNLDQFRNLGIFGIHEARAFMIGDQYKLALATYFKAKLIILSSSDPDFKKVSIEFEDEFSDNRVRALFVGDIDGDGQEEVVVGTRPSGILEYYKYNNGKWSGTRIDRVGSAIHDIIIADSDRDGNNEIFADTSTITEYKTQNLQIETPKVIRYKLSGGIWNKEVVWEAKTMTRDLYFSGHARYIFSGNFDGKGASELVSGVVGYTGLDGLLMLKWNGSGYSQNLESIDKGIKISTDVIASGDVDNDGKDEILLPTLAGDAMLLYKWQGDKWGRSVIAKNLIDNTIYNENIISMAVLSSVSDGYKKILYVTGSDDPKSGGNPKFYILAYNSSRNEWERTLVGSPDLPGTTSWGIFPMSSWKISRTPNKQ